MKVLVTGASGFIGLNLIKKLLKQEDVLVYGFSRTNPSFKNNNYIPVLGDMTIQNWTNMIPSSVDTVIHLAQSNRYREFPEGAKDMINVNINATLDLLEWSRNNKVHRFFFASTGNVYKRSKKLHIETDECIPESMYDATKLSAEYLIQQYSMFFNTIIMRIFGVYGPNQQNGLFPLIIDSVRSGKEIILAKEKGIFLTPLYITDCLEMICRLVQLNLQNRNEIFNIAGCEAIHLGNIVNIIAEDLKLTPNIHITSEEPKYLMGSNQKICFFMHSTPKINFKDGIRKCLDNH